MTSICRIRTYLPLMRPRDLLLAWVRRIPLDKVPLCCSRSGTRSRKFAIAASLGAPRRTRGSRETYSAYSFSCVIPCPDLACTHTGVYKPHMHCKS